MVFTIENQLSRKKGKEQLTIEGEKKVLEHGVVTEGLHHKCVCIAERREPAMYYVKEHRGGHDIGVNFHMFKSGILPLHFALLQKVMRSIFSNPL